MTQISVGVALTVHVVALDDGELGASVGIEGHAEVRTEALEFCEIERNADGSSTLPAHLLFAILGPLEPIGVSGGQLVTVFHPGLDLFVVAGAVPALGYVRSCKNTH